MLNWDHIQDVFAQASEIPSERWAEFLAGACLGNQDEEREVRRLLNAQEGLGNFLETPVAKVKPGETALLPGDLVNSRFSIEREIGRGGFGCVYLAEDQQLSGKKVVVKVLDRRSLDGWSDRAFDREMRLLARLNHPGIVQILDYGEVAGNPFLVMQYVPGVTLRKVIEEPGEPWPAARVASFLQRLASALAAIHAQDMCHRDLKPENIMVCNAGQRDEHPVIIDFGVAVLTGTDAPAVTTRVAGSPEYMAPEQLLGRPAPASDIYSLGLIAFELLSRRKLHEFESGPSPEAIVSTELAAHRKDLPAAAQKVISRAVCFDLKSRYPNVTELSEAFTRALAPPASPRKHGRVAGVAVAILLAALAGYWRWSAVPAGAPQSLEYRMDLQRFDPSGPAGEPVAFEPATRTVAPGDGLAISVRSNVAGYFYIFDETPAGEWNILFPSSEFEAIASAGAWVRSPSDTAQWIRPDGKSLEEWIWIVWSASVEPSLERARVFANPQDRGEIRDTTLRSDIKRLLLASRVGPGPLAKHSQQVAALQVRLRESAGSR